MVKILFVCHGNICRSPMAEFIMKKLVKDAGYEDDFLISSAATSNEEIGNDIYPQAKAALQHYKIPFEHHRARRIRRNEYSDWDYIIAMDEENLENISYIIGSDDEKKIRLLLSFTGEDRSVADPWYTRDFEKAYKDIYRGCEALLIEVAKIKFK